MRNRHERRAARNFAKAPLPAGEIENFEAQREWDWEGQMTALADYIQAALMLKYNERKVG